MTTIQGGATTEVIFMIVISHHDVHHLHTLIEVIVIADDQAQDLCKMMFRIGLEGRRVTGATNDTTIGTKEVIEGGTMIGIVDLVLHMEVSDRKENPTMT